MSTLWGLPALLLLGPAASAQQSGLPGNLHSVPHAVLIALHAAEDAPRIARQYGLHLTRRLHSDPRWCVFHAPSPLQARAALSPLSRDRRVRHVVLDAVRPRTRFQFVPNDPYFAPDVPASGWPGQWYLYNQTGAGPDAGVMGAWQRDLTGQGVVIGIVDDGVQADHPDLRDAFRAADSYDFGEDDPDPSPVSSFDRHGTAVAGVAGARGGNGTGIAGTAPHAQIAGLRVDFDFSPVSAYVDATLYRSGSGIRVKNHSYGYAFPYVPAEAESEALALSAAAGTIHCYAAGNLRGGIAEDANKMDEQNSPDVICVAALGYDGRFAPYSNFGACVFVTAPSGHAGGPGVISTDRTGAEGFNTSEFDADPFPDLNYTSTFGGTSAAAPIVAGVIALGKQAQPALDVRFARHLLARTSLLIDPLDTTESGDGWRVNAAGLAFNQNYGFGLINADAFTQEAVRYTGVTPLQTVTTGRQEVNAPIPDNSVAGIARTFVVSADTPLEDVLITLEIDHSTRGQLEAYLTSPRGTTCRLFRRHPADSGSGIYWTFCTNAFWGENPRGMWTLKMVDTQAGRTGIWRAFHATWRMGRLIGPGLTGRVLLEGVADTRQPVTFTLHPVSSGTPVVRTLTLDASGAFALEDLPPGHYRLAVKGAKWLRRVLPVDLTHGSLSGIEIALAAGDANNDNVVDVLDLAELIAAFDATPGAANWNEGRADLNCDNVVDVLDLDLLVRNFDAQGDA
ncbi:MAG: S8 family serine peptidase [Chloroherpetonaceae bacterium]|nr:S8 family serine peptidase [Chloroherpetonaceae bacterium]